MTAVRLAYLALLIAVATAIDIHLPLMQVAAWTSMIVNYSEDRDLADAIEMTFDGDHPCPMCKAIEAERTRTNPDSLQSTPGTQLSLFLDTPVQWHHATILLGFCATGHMTHVTHSRPPDTPPPILERC